MFKYDWMEFFSKVHPSIPPILFVPIITFFCYQAIFVAHLEEYRIALVLICGVFFWTITEYFLHRFIFHLKFKSKIGRRIHFIFHGVHHDYPNDSRRLVMPPSVSLPLSAIFYLLFSSVLGKETAAPFFSGFLIGYLFYDLTHYAIHHFSIKNKFWLYLKKHHSRHHYQNSNAGFGVSSPIWDFVFGTSFNEEKSESKANVYEY
jgi:sterol desaturase/sphingolipid hydroxylase (fatty acid hydroxylase superfamily)